MNKENLLKAADFIEKVPENKFDMIDYREHVPGAHVDPKCKTVGCVIGHCTALDKENVKKNFMASETRIDFRNWSCAFFGMAEGSWNEWDWCFGMEWRDADNTPTGAAKRIRYLVKNGLPENWEDQMYGLADLCYQ